MQLSSTSQSESIMFWCWLSTVYPALFLVATAGIRKQDANDLAALVAGAAMKVALLSDDTMLVASSLLRASCR